MDNNNAAVAKTAAEAMQVPPPLTADDALLVQVRTVSDSPPPATPSGKQKLHRRRKSSGSKKKGDKPPKKIKRVEKFASEGKHEVQLVYVETEFQIVAAAAKLVRQRPGQFARDSSIESAKKILRREKHAQSLFRDQRRKDSQNEANEVDDRGEA